MNKQAETVAAPAPKSIGKGLTMPPSIAGVIQYPFPRNMVNNKGAHNMSRRWPWRIPIRATLATGLSIAVFTLTSCATKHGDPSSALGTNTAAESQSATTKRHPDRDPQQVDDGLSKINPCALVRAFEPLLDGHGYPARTIGEPTDNPLMPDMRDCLALTNDVWSRVLVTVDLEFTEAEHYALDPLNFTGFTGYFGDETVAPDFEWLCTVRIPVSFTRSIVVEVDRDRKRHHFDACALVKALAQKVIADVVTAAGPELLYRYGEQDENVEGACAHWLSLGTHAGCIPYRNTEVPSNGRRILEMAAENPNVERAASLNIVRDVLGARMQPVVINGHSCVFVEPRHEIRVSIDMSDSDVPGQYEFGDLPAEKIEVADHPAFSTLDHTDHEVTLSIFVSAGNDVNNPGMIHGEITITNPRGTAESTSVIADESKLDFGKSITTLLTSRYF